MGSAAYAAALEQAGAALERVEVAGRARPPAVRVEQLAVLLKAAAREQEGSR